VTGRVSCPQPRLWDGIRSEWTKLRTVRATLWSLLAAAGLCLGTAALVARSPNVPPGTAVGADDAVRVALAGFLFGQIAIGVLGALAVTSEYGSGAIRSSLAAVPSRLRFLLSKAAAVAGTVLVCGVLLSGLSYLVAHVVMTSRAARVAALSAGSVRALLGAALYLTVLSLFTVALGVLLRHSAGAITTVICLVLILPTLLPAFGRTGQAIYRWWPTEAGQQVMRVEPVPGQLTPWVGFGWCCVVTAALLTVAYLVLRRRDT